MTDSVSTPTLAVRPEHFGDDRFAAIFRRGEAQHLDDDLVVRLGPLGARIADENAMAEDGAIDADEELAVAREVGADELAGGPFEHLDDLPLGPAVVDLARWPNAHQDDIAGGGIADRLLGDEDFGELVPFLGIGADEAEAGGRLAEDAGEGPMVGRRLRTAFPLPISSRPWRINSLMASLKLSFSDGGKPSLRMRAFGLMA